MNADTVVIGPEETFARPLPLSGAAVVLSTTMDQLFMDTVRPLSLEQEPATRAELCAIAIGIIEGGKQKAAQLPGPQKSACILLEGELRVLAGLLKSLVREESQPARSVLFELLVLVMGNGWRRGNHVIPERAAMEEAQ